MKKARSRKARIFYREVQKSENLKQLQKMQQKEAEKEMGRGLFKVGRMLFLHNIISSIFGGRK
jgi:hypothetical protein